MWCWKRRNRSCRQGKDPEPKCAFSCIASSWRYLDQPCRALIPSTFWLLFPPSFLKPDDFFCWAKLLVAHCCRVVFQICFCPTYCHLFALVTSLFSFHVLRMLNAQAHVSRPNPLEQSRQVRSKYLASSLSSTRIQVRTVHGRSP